MKSTWKFMSLWCRQQKTTKKLTSIDKILIICRSDVRHMSTTWDWQKMTWDRQKTTWDWHTIDKKQQKPWNFTSTWRRHRFLCRHNVYINFRGFCRFLSMVCWFDVDFGRVHVEFMSTTSNDMYRLHIDTNFCVDMMSTSKFMIFVVFCQLYVDLMSILVDPMSSTCVEHTFDKNRHHIWKHPF